MKKTFLVLLLFLPALLQAQIENVVVETYYITDANDATDTTGGGIAAGTTTYRIYIDMAPGSILKKIYGDANHTFAITSTQPFFNNLLDGQTFANEFSKSRYGDNTVALDTWLTLGQTTRNSAKTYYGTPKTLDDDGSFIGGVNNDGGSNAVAQGLLINNDPLAGILLTTSDGMDTIATAPTLWASNGIFDLTSGDDSTAFGSLKTSNAFISNSFSLQNSGVRGVVADTNMVLVAQLTTAGDLSFEMNVEIEQLVNNVLTTVHYVANDSILLAGEILSPFLKYPQACGCTDANYLEYSNAYACSDNAQCQTLIVFGCMDTLACNYDPAVNYNLQTLCCYPGYCQNRDLGTVCPQLNVERTKIVNFNFYPNPASNHINLQFQLGEAQQTNLEIYNHLGALVMKQDLGNVQGAISQNINLQKLNKGIYQLRLFTHKDTVTQTFIKN